MKNPLRYQMTEYDCGPTSLLNAVSFLFEREQIPPELVRSVMLFCLDCFGADGAAGKCGTSCMAMQFLCSWLGGFGRAGHLTVRASYLSGRDVHFSANGRLRDALRRGGAVKKHQVGVVRQQREVALVRVFGDVGRAYDVVGRGRGLGGMRRVGHGACRAIEFCVVRGSCHG